MSAPNYSQVPPADFHNIQTSYPPPPQHENKQFSSNVEESQPFSKEAQTASEPHTRWQRMKLKYKIVSHKFWLLEAAASVFSLIILAIIMGILKWYDNTYYGDTATRSPTKRPTLFPVLAILGAIMRAAMLLPVATAIGQLKWGWFRSSRRLLDMERFDEAARGLLGSAKLLWTLRFRNPAMVGAALTILALPLDAVIQSAVLLPSTLRLNKTVYPQYPNITDTTSISRSTWYNASQTMSDPATPWPATQMINAIKWGYSYDIGLADLFEATTRVDCPSGYCTFNKQQTLAIGSQCINRTAEIQTIPSKNGAAAYQTLPQTDLKFYHIGGQSGNQSYQRQIIAAESWNGWPDQPYKGVKFDQDSLGPIIVRTPMILNWFEGAKYTTDQIAKQTIAFECALYWYVSTETPYVNETSSFTLDFMDHDVEFNSSRYQKGSGNRYALEPKQCYVEGKQAPKDETDFYKDNCLFVVGEGAAKALENMAWDDIDGLQGTSFLINGTQRKWTRTNNFITNLYATGSTGLDTMDETNQMSWKMVNTMWSNIAYGMSFTVRRSPSLLSNQNGTKLLLTTGKVWQPVYYWSIDWPRLAAPIFVVAFAAFFVLYTAILTRKEYAWRRSALPLLFHGLEDRERIALGDVRSLVTMQNVAEKLHVRLDEHIDANGARLTTQH